MAARWSGLAAACAFAAAVQADPNFRFTVVGAGQHSGSSESAGPSVLLTGRAASADVAGDAWLLAETSVPSDFDARVGGFQDSLLAPTGMRGVMARTRADVDAPFVAVLLDAQGQCRWRYRQTAGNGWLEIPIPSQNPAAGVALERAGGLFRAYYRETGSAQWTQAPAALGMDLPDVLSLGICLGSRDTAAQAVRATQVSGFPLPPPPIAPCAVYRFGFNDGRTPADLGFSPLRSVSKITSEDFVRTATAGGAAQSSLLGAPIQSIPVVQDTQQVVFKFRADRASGRDYRAYALVSKEWTELRDRAKVSGGGIWAGGAVKVGNDALMQGSIEANGLVTLLDRARVEGDVTASGAITRGNQSVITGTVRTNTPVPAPSLPDTSWALGTTDVTVNPDQTRDLPPGNYRNVTVYSRCKLHFQAGVYRFASLWIDTDVKWYIHNTAFAGTEVFAQNAFRLGDRDVIIPSDSSGGPVLRVYSNQTADNRLGTDMKLFGEFIFPKCNLAIPSRTTSLRGGIYAKSIWLDPDAIVQAGAFARMTDTLRLTVGGSSGNPFVLEQCIGGGSPSARDKLRIKTPAGAWQEKTLASASVPGTWQAWDVRFVPKARGGGIRWFNDMGTGPQSAFSLSGSPGGDSIRSVQIEYLAQPGRLARQVSLDEIGIGCLNPGCPALAIPAQPRDTAVWEGQTARFSVGVYDPKVAYQWFADGQALPNETGAELNVRKAAPAQNGKRYRCRLKSNCDSAFSREAVLTVRPCGTVALWQHPASVTVREGAATGFKVNAGGIGQFSYTWYRNGVPIDGVTGDTLPIPAARLSDHGTQYRAKVSDGCGMFELSDAASLYVLADSACRAAEIRGPDTVRAGRIYGYEFLSHCEGGGHSWTLDGGARKSAPGSSVLALGPFAYDSSGSNLHVLKVHSHNRFGRDSAQRQITVLPPVQWAQTVSVAGVLRDGNGTPQDGLFHFTAELWDRELGGRRVFRETYPEALVPVILGEYTVSLGSGISDSPLASVLEKHGHLFVTLTAGRYDVEEPIVERLPLSAVPFALRKQP